jgi:PhoH-like ATPase
MPLPPAPAKRAAFLNTEGLDTAPAKSRSARKPTPRQEPREIEEPMTAKAPTTATPAPRKSEPLPAYKGERKPTLARATTPKKKHTGPTKLFVLDTNVLMHDPMCLFRFEEHDVFLPMIVLEELDSNKKGMTEVARNARQTSRSLDALVASHNADIIGHQARWHRPH